jgi:LacI family transcriptional regulator
MSHALPVTIRQVAAAGGVSPATVTRALRNDARLLPATIARIQQLAQQMGYVKNSTVAMLMTQLRNSRRSSYVATIAMVNASRSRNGWRNCDAFVRYWQGAEQRAEWLGYKLEEFWLGEPGMNAQKAAKILLSRGIRGLLLWPTENPASLSLFPWKEFAACSVGYALANPRLPYASADHYQMASVSLAELSKRGYVRIGLLMDQGFDTYLEGRLLSCYLRYQSELPRPLPPFLIQSSLTASDMDKRLQKWFRQYRPDALLIISSLYLPRMESLRDLLKKKIGLASLDITNRNSHHTGVYSKPEVVAAASIDLIIEQLQHNQLGVPEHPKSVLIESEWLSGKTP